MPFQKKQNKNQARNGLLPCAERGGDMNREMEIQCNV